MYQVRYNCCNLREHDNDGDNDNENACVFNLVTVERQEQQYSGLDIDRAKKARKLQVAMGFISERDMLHMIDNNLIVGSKFDDMT